MTLANSISYFTTLFVLTLAPGPILLMIVVRAASNDMRGAIGLAFGSAVACVVIIAAVCFGIATWLTAVPEVFEYSKYVMMVYFVWLAYGILKCGFDMNGDCEVSRRSIWSSAIMGLIAGFISPYYMILFPLVLPEIMDVTSISLSDFVIVAAITFISVSVANVFVVSFAAQLRRIAKSEYSTLMLNRSLASVLVSVGGVMVMV